MNVTLRRWRGPWGGKGGLPCGGQRVAAAASVEVAPLVACPGHQASPGPVGGAAGRKDGDPQSLAGTLAAGTDTCEG